MSSAGDPFHHRRAEDHSNRPFKGRSKSTRSKNKGEEKVRPSLKKRDLRGDKEQRQNKFKQHMADQRHQQQSARRFAAGGTEGPPKLVGIVSLCPTVDVELVKAQLFPLCSDIPAAPAPGPITTSAMVGKKKLRMTLFGVERDAMSVMDLGKAADLIVLVTGTSGKPAAPAGAEVKSMEVEGGLESKEADVAVDAIGEQSIRLLKAQGLPSLLAVSLAPANSTPAQKVVARNQLSKEMKERFPSDLDIKCISLAVGNNADAVQFLRYIEQTPIQPIGWRDMRAHMLVEQIAFSKTSDQRGELRFRGYLRGKRVLSANQLVHLTGYQDYQISMIEEVVPSPRHPAPAASASGMEVDAAPAESSVVCVSKADPAQQESLLGLDQVDAFAREQSLISEQQIREAEEEEMKARQQRSTQSAWEDVLKEGEAEEKKMGLGRDAAADEDVMFDEKEWKSVEASLAPEPRQKQMLELRKRAQEDREFPDEVITPVDQPARTRFQRYRNLESMAHPWDKNESLPLEYGRIVRFQRFAATKKRLLQQGLFSPFAAVSSSASSASPSVAGGDVRDQEMVDVEPEAKSDAPAAAPAAAAAAPASDQMMEDVDAPAAAPAAASSSSSSSSSAVSVTSTTVDWGNVALPGMQVIVHCPNVPVEIASSLMSSSPATPHILSSLFSHEHRVSVLHFLVKRVAGYEEPIKGKERMMVHCGFRRFSSRPVYSDDGRNNDKHLMERFFQQGRFSIATVYARITISDGTVPVLMFTDPTWPSPAPSQAALALHCAHPSSGQLVATGSLFSVDPDRLVLKRITLTGYPMRVRKKHAVVRYMFFHPDDVQWFAPVHLWTRYGLKGQIREPLGTKGLFKASFSSIIKGNDTICMSLYKRQFPPFDENEFLEL